MDFGQQLKEIRIQQKYSQADLSNKTGLTVRTIQRIESNEVKPSIHSLRVLSEALGTDVSQLSNVEKIKPYEFHFQIKINDMNQFLTDLKSLMKNHWRIITMLILIIWLMTNYTDIKAGIMDGWAGQ